MHKTYLRNTMDQSQLSDLCVITFNSDILELINVDEIIDLFASIRERRLKFNL